MLSNLRSHIGWRQPTKEQKKRKNGCTKRVSFEFHKGVLWCFGFLFFCQSKKLKCFHSSGVVFLMTSSYQSCDLGSRSGDSNVRMIWIQSFMSISIAMLLSSLQSSSSSSTFINNIVFFITFFIIKSLCCCSQNHVVYSTARRCVFQTLLRSCKARSKRCGQPKFGAGPASLPGRFPTTYWDLLTLNIQNKSNFKKSECRQDVWVLRFFGFCNQTLGIEQHAHLGTFAFCDGTAQDQQMPTFSSFCWRCGS